MRWALLDDGRERPHTAKKRGKRVWPDLPEQRISQHPYYDKEGQLVSVICRFAPGAKWPSGRQDTQGAPLLAGCRGMEAGESQSRQETALHAGGVARRRRIQASGRGRGREVRGHFRESLPEGAGDDVAARSEVVAAD